ncbi:MAG TPA: hypothetical protein VH969_15820 [Actinophytocola sp.]
MKRFHCGDRVSGQARSDSRRIAGTLARTLRVSLRVSLRDGGTPGP